MNHPSPRPRFSPGIWVAVSLGVVVVVIAAFAVGQAVGSAGSSADSSASSVPAQFRTPLGCDTRGDSECADRTIFQRLCDVDISRLPSPELFQRSEPGESAMIVDFLYSDRGNAVVNLHLDDDGWTYVCFEPQTELTMTSDERYALDKAGDESVLPAELRAR